MTNPTPGDPVSPTSDAKVDAGARFGPGPILRRLALLLVPTALLLWVLSTSPVERVLADAVRGAAAQRGLVLDFTRLEVRPWRRTVQLLAPQVRPETREGAAVWRVAADNAAVAWDPLSGLRVRLDQPEIFADLRTLGEPEQIAETPVPGGLPDTKAWVPYLFELPAVDLRDGRIELVLANTPASNQGSTSSSAVHLVGEPIDLAIGRTDLEQEPGVTGFLEILDWQLLTDASPVPLGSTRLLWLRPSDDIATLRGTVLGGTDSLAEFASETNIMRSSGTVESRWSTQPEIRRLSRILAAVDLPHPRLEARGEIGLELTTTWHGSAVSGGFEITTENVALPDSQDRLQPISLRTAGTWSPVQVQFEGFDFAALGGKLRAEGSVPLDLFGIQAEIGRRDDKIAGAEGLDLRLEGLELAAVLDSLVSSKPPFDTRADGDFSIRWSDAPVPAVSSSSAAATWSSRLARRLAGNGTLRFSPPSRTTSPDLPLLTGALQLASEPDAAAPALRFDGSQLQTAGISMELDGVAGLDSWDLQYRALIKSLGSQQQIAAWRSRLQLPEDLLAGSVAAAGLIRGGPRAPRLTARLGGEPGIDGEPYRLAGDLILENAEVFASGVALEPLREASDGLRLAIDGTAPLRQGAEDWDLRWSVEGLPTRWAPATLRDRLDGGSLAVRGEVQGPWQGHQLQLYAASEQLRSRSGRAASIQAEARLRGPGWHRWAAAPLILSVGDGRLEASLDPREDGSRLRIEGQNLPTELLWPGLDRLLPGASFDLTGDADFGSGLPERAELTMRLPSFELRGVEQRGFEARLRGGRREWGLSGRRTPEAESEPQLLSVTVDGEAIEGVLDFGQLDASTLSRALLPVTSKVVVRDLQGRLTARTEQAPPTPAGTSLGGSLDHLLVTRPSGGELRLGSGSVQLSGSLSTLEFDELRLTGDGVDLRASGRLPLLASTEARGLEIDLEGSTSLDLIGELLPGTDLDGEADVDLTWSGAIGRPAVRGRVRVAGATGQLSGLRLRDVGLEIELPQTGPGHLSGGGQLFDGRVHFEGTLAGPGIPWPQRVQLHADGIDLAPLLDLPQRPWRLVLSARGELQWSERGGAPSGSGTLRLDDLTLGHHQTASLFEAAPWQIRKGRFSSQPLVTYGNALEGQVQLDAHLPDGRTQPTDAAFRARIDGRVALGFLSELGQLDPAFAFLDGPADVGVEVAWHPSSPTPSGNSEQGLLLHGTARPERAEFVLHQPLVRLTEVDGDLTFEGRSITLDRLRGTSGAGSVEVDGTLGLNQLLALDQADLRIYVDRLPLSPVAGMDGLAWSQLTVRSKPATSGVSAGSDPAPTRFAVRGRTLYRRARYSANLASGSPEAETLAQIRWEDTGDEIDLLEQFDLDLRISSEDLLVDNELAQIAVDARLQVTGTAARPLIGGSVETSAPGEAYLGGRTYEVDQISVQLDDYPNQPPFVRARSTTEAGGERVQVRLDGPTDDIRMDLYAPDNPTLGQADLAALLVTGRSANAASEGVTELAVAQAASYLGDLITAQTGVDLGLFFGTPTSIPILSSETDPESRFTVGRSLTEDLSIAYSVGLEEAEDRLWILDWRPMRNLWVRAIEENANAYIAELASQSQFDLRGNAETSTRPRSRIGSVIYDGPSATDLGLGEWVGTRLERGRRLRINELRSEGDRIRLQLVRAGWLGAEVDVEPVDSASGLETTPASDATDSLDRLDDPQRDDAGRIDIVISIRPGRRYAIEWRGDDVGPSERDWVRDHWTQGGAIEPRLAQLGRDLRHRLQAEGWFRARVETSSVTPPGLRVRNAGFDPERPTRLVFDVDLGPRTAAPTIRFENNTLVTDEELLAELPAADDPKRYALLDDERSQLRQRLALRYAQVGVLDLEIERITGLVEGLGSGDLRDSDPEASPGITVVLLEGRPRKLMGIEFPGAETLPPKQLVEACGLTLYEPIDLTAYGASRGGLLSAYREAGYWQTRVRARLRRTETRARDDVDGDRTDRDVPSGSPDGVIAVFEVEEGYRARVASIRWQGDTITRRSVLAAQLDFQVGGDLTSVAVLETQRRLYNLGLFRSVEVLPIPREDAAKTDDESASRSRSTVDGTPAERQVDVTITVYDKPNLILDYGLRYRARANESASVSSRSADNEGFELAFRTRLLQPFGAGGVASLSFFPQRDRDVARLRYDRPLFFGHPINSSVFLEAREDRRPEFDLQFESQTLTLQLGRELFAQRRRANPGRARVQLQWGLQAQWARVVPGSEAVPIPELRFNETFRRTQLNLNLVIDDRDDVVDPRVGTLWSGSLQGGTSALGSDFDFVRFYGEGAVYRTLPSTTSWVWASGIKVGTIETNQAFPFLEDRFTAGGAYSVRGFDVRDLGPQINGEAIGGRAVAVLHQELRFPLLGLLRGGVFVDSGAVFTDSRDFTLDQFRTSTGLGLRATLPFGVLRLDWARVVDGPQIDRGRERFHIAFGHAF